MPSRFGQDKVAEAGVLILALPGAGSDDFLAAGVFCSAGISAGQNSVCHVSAMVCSFNCDQSWGFVSLLRFNGRHMLPALFCGPHQC
jgi:hypothetical protein